MIFFKQSTVNMFSTIMNGSILVKLLTLKLEMFFCYYNRWKLSFFCNILLSEKVFQVPHLQCSKIQIQNNKTYDLHYGPANSSHPIDSEVLTKVETKIRNC